MKKPYHYLFGPVPSRRLGRSLGIDVTPQNTCSFDCVFCQCGTTVNHVSERGEFVPFDAVCSELAQWIDEDGQADFITFAGSGEPTLYSRLGDLIDFIKARTAIPVMVLTNGTLLHRPDVREETAKADVVKMSLSAWNEESFRRINRPAAGITLADTLRGEREFRGEFRGELWLEVFLLEGFNAEREQVRRIAEAVAPIGADKIHLNTAVRPPAESAARPVGPEKLASFCDLFSPPAEVIASFKPRAENREEASPEKLLALIRRHPATAAQLAEMFSAPPEEIAALLAPLTADGTLQTEERNGELYFK